MQGNTVEMVIEPCPVTFTQSNSNQIIAVHVTIHTSCNIVVKTTFNEFQILQ